jgi:hypothetical protein
MANYKLRKLLDWDDRHLTDSNFNIFVFKIFLTYIF